ncbi:MAG: zinc finger domain-containing protein [Prosthecobacter sp.]|uniref:zinc finger domain-containing protein n=1 Tax=Prosthecobacter sp. TaxID=1965333 RepID=UPI0039027A80
MNQRNYIARSTLAAVVAESAHPKWARCWKHLPDGGTHAEHLTLCGRCVEAVGEQILFTNGGRSI